MNQSEEFQKEMNKNIFGGCPIFCVNGVKGH
jgi:hypothetical protein